MAIVKCRNCGKQIDRDLAIAISERRYVCSDECKAEVESKKKESSTTQEKEQRKNLISYLTKISVGKINYPKETAYLKKIIKENPDFTINGIKYTLWYIVSIEKKKINGLGLVPYYYGKAKNYYVKLENVKKSVDKIEPKQSKEIIIVKTNKYREKDIFE